MKVYKYDIPLADHFTLMLPKIAKILSVQVQHNAPKLWVAVEESDLIECRFRLAGTGHEITDYNLSFIGTFQLNGGELVFHLFEIGDEK